MDEAASLLDLPIPAACRDGVARNQDLVACSRSGTNYDFTWYGFFTPS